jgi:hypothetical protein
LKSSLSCLRGLQGLSTGKILNKMMNERERPCPVTVAPGVPPYAGRQNDVLYPEATDQDKVRRFRLESEFPALTLYATGTVSMLFFSASRFQSLPVSISVVPLQTACGVFPGA